MPLESEVVEKFLSELRKDGIIDEFGVAQVQLILKQKSLTEKTLMDLIRDIATSKGKKRQH